MPFRKIGKNPQQLPLLGVRFVNTCHLFLLSATYTISYAEPNFKIPFPHFYFTFTSRTAIYGLDGMSIVNSPLWRPCRGDGHVPGVDDFHLKLLAFRHVERATAWAVGSEIVHDTVFSRMACAVRAASLIKECRKPAPYSLRFLP